MRQALRLMWLDLRNMMMELNSLLVWLAFGTDPRMTFSALVHLNGWTRLERVIDWLYARIAGQKDHCKEAATGWRDWPHDRSVRFPVYLPLRIALLVGIIYVWRRTGA